MRRYGSRVDTNCQVRRRAIVRCSLVMRWAPAVLVVIPSVSAADPDLRKFEDCKARRQQLMPIAMQESDLEKRAHMLQELPECVREPDGRLVVTDPNAPRPPEPPFDPGPWGSLDVGAAGSVVAYYVRPASSVGAFVDVDAAWRIDRRYSVGLFAGVEAFHDGSYLGMYDVHHQFYSLGARGWVHFGDLRVGPGIGALVDHAAAFADVPATTAPDLLVEIAASYDLAHAGPFMFSVGGHFMYARATANDPNDLSAYGDVLSARLGVGVLY